MGFFSTIGAFISNVCSTISSICSKLDSTVGKIISTALIVAITVLNPIAGLIIGAISLITELLKKLAPEVPPEEVESGELAVKAEVCEDLLLEDYSTTSEYIQGIRDSIENDPLKREAVNEKMNNMTPVERDSYKLVSVGLADMVIAEKLDIDFVDPSFLAIAKVVGLDADQTIAFSKELNDKGVSTTDVREYFLGNLKGEDFERTGDGIKAAIEKVYPEMKTDEQKAEVENSMFEKWNAAIKEQETKMEENL